MKKRLLFAFMAMCVAVSGFALTNGEYVYTPQGRFKISGDLVAYSNFTDFSGWEAVTATEGTMVQDIFTLDANGPVAGTGCAVSSNGTAGEGMYFKFTPTSAGSIYVVSFKMKGVAQSNVRVGSGSLNQNVVKVEGNSDGVYAGTNNVLLCNRGEELSEDWQTFNYAIVGDGTTTRTYFISFVSMQTNIYIADLQIAEALQVADLRARDAALEKINAYKNVYAWPEDVLTDYAINETIEKLNSIEDQTAQSILDDALEEADDVLATFINENMDDYLATNALNYLNLWPGKKTQNATKAGEWTCLPTNRGFWENESQGAWDMGHYAGSLKWGSTAYGVTMQKELIPGSYVFTIDGAAAYRETSSSSMWGMNQGLKVGVATAYIVKVPAEGAESTAADTLGVVVKGLDAVDYTTSIVAVQIKESGVYEIGYKVVPREDLQSLTRGGVVFVKNASISGKNESKYNQKQLAYEADVREQIAAGRKELTIAAENIANAEKPWGKAELQACVDTIAPKIAGFEALTQEAIIDTYEDFYENKIGEGVALMVDTVYQEAVKDIKAANSTFKAVNDTLASMQTAIDAAENVLTQRIYDAATGKDALKAAIAKAQETQAAMKAAQYSEENANAIKQANAELSDAVETFKATIPATATEEIISIDFENGAKQNAETLAYEVSGNNTVMTVENFSETTPIADEKGRGTMNFELGIDSNGEKVLPGVLRVGDGSAVATIPAKDYGTNIVKVSMDFWFIRLSNGLVGFELTDENDARVAGMKYVPYNNNLTGSGSAKGFDDFKIGDSNYGSFFKSNTAGDAASCADNNLSHIECILDYGEKSMYLVSTNESGSFTSEKVAFNGLVPVKITISSNYKSYIGRRCWFDNLKIEMIQAGATEPFVGIENAKAADAKEAPVKVLENGQIIIGGKYNVAGAVVK